jgi:hypothetical protein
MTHPNPSSSPEQVCGVLATIYRRAIERYEEAKATNEDGSEGREGRRKNEFYERSTQKEEDLTSQAITTQRRRRNRAL